MQHYEHTPTDILRFHYAVIFGRDCRRAHHDPIDTAVPGGHAGTAGVDQRAWLHGIQGTAH